MRIAQACKALALRALKLPAGGLDWPKLSLPQQATLSSLLIAQVLKAPALSEVKVAAGGVVCPLPL